MSQPLLETRGLANAFGAFVAVDNVDLSLAPGDRRALNHIILDAIGELPSEIAVLIIEHDMDVVFRFARRITVMVRGNVLFEGTPEETRASSEVRDVYLGQNGGHA